MNPWFFADLLGFIGAACFVGIVLYRIIASRRIAKLINRPREGAAVAGPAQEPTHPCERLPE